MSIASLILSSVASQAGAVGGKPSIRQQAGQDFEQLFQALQSGNLSGAQQAYNDLQQLRSASTSGTSGTTGATDNTSPVAATPRTTAAASPVAADWSSLGQALNAGSLTSAQDALSKLKQDVATQWQSELQNARAIYALMSGAASSTHPMTLAGTGGNTVQSDLANLQAALQTGDTAGAQKLLAQLEQDLQSSGQVGQTRHHHHHRHHHHGFASQDPASAYPTTVVPAAAAASTSASTASTVAAG